MSPDASRAPEGAGRPGRSCHARSLIRWHTIARQVEIGVPDIRRLCKWLGSTDANRRFNRLARYVLHESSRYCPSEDHDSSVDGAQWNWRNPFTAYNCTWGFATPTDYPEIAEGGRAPCAKGEAGVSLVERSNSTTCPRVMLCDVHVGPDGHVGKPLEKASRRSARSVPCSLLMRMRMRVHMPIHTHVHVTAKHAHVNLHLRTLLP